MRAVAVVIAAVAALALPTLALGAGGFTFVQPGFTSELYGTGGGFFGGVAFAPNNDVWVDFCQFGGSPLNRFDNSTTTPVNGSNVHPLVPGSPFPSNAGCGLTNNPNGSLYSNTSGGVTRLDASTGAPTGGPFGPGGNALGIASDPQTGDLVYVGGDGTIYRVNAALTTSSTFSAATAGRFIDGIAWTPDGNFLFLSTRSPFFRLTVLDRTGAIVNDIPLTHEPDGIAFHAGTPKFVLTNNTDGTIVRYDFPGDNYALPPVQSIFASGGFRGDLSQVGPDGCVYVTQDGTRYADGTVAGGNSIVRICAEGGGGFSPPPGVAETTPPDCSLSAVIAGPPKQIQVTVGDSGSGLKTVVVNDTNAVTAVPAFTTGQTTPIVVTSTKVDQSQGASLQLTITDVDGNTTVCDPVYGAVHKATIRLGGRGTVHLLSVKPTTSVVTLRGTPGVHSVRLTVNGRVYLVPRLGHGHAVSVDIWAAIRRGSTHNIVVATVQGKRGAKLTLTTSD